MRIQELAAALNLSHRDGARDCEDVWVNVARTAIDELNGRKVVSAILDVQADGTIVEIRPPEVTDAMISPSLPDEPQVDGDSPLPAWASYRSFRDAARALKQAESAFKAAQVAYAEAVKRLSEEAVK